MKDKLRELAGDWLASAEAHTKSGFYTAAVINVGRTCAAELLAILDAEGDGVAVGKVPSGWEIRWHTEGDDSLLLITHRKHGGVGAHKDATDARTIPEEMLYLLARDLLTTNIHPARSGVVSDEDERAVDAMRALLVKSLMAYRCIRTVDEDGEPLPLVDALSPGEGGTIQPGTEEIEYLAEYLAYELQGPPAQVAQVPDKMHVGDARNAFKNPLIHDGYVAGWNACRAAILGVAFTAEPAAQGEATEFPDCSGDPSSCPENEGHGCCKAPSPDPTDGIGLSRFQAQFDDGDEE